MEVKNSMAVTARLQQPSDRKLCSAIWALTFSGTDGTCICFADYKCLISSYLVCNSFPITI